MRTVSSLVGERRGQCRVGSPCSEYQVGRQPFSKWSFFQPVCETRPRNSKWKDLVLSLWVPRAVEEVELRVGGVRVPGRQTAFSPAKPRAVLLLHRTVLKTLDPETSVFFACRPEFCGKPSQSLISSLPSNSMKSSSSTCRRSQR